MSFILFVACNTNKKDSQDINKNPRIIYYQNLKKVWRKEFRKNGYDSIVEYYKNGNVYRTGKLDINSQRFGNWYLYTLEGKLSQTIEFFVINKKSITNRFWYFNKAGDTIWYAGKFNRFDQKEFEKDTIGPRASTMIDFVFYTKDTISLDEPYLVSVICNSPIARKYNSEIKMLLAKEDYNFNKDFSNESEVKLDTFFNLTRDIKNRGNFTYREKPESKYPYIVAFGRWFDSPGKKILRGYMSEYFNRNKKAKNYAFSERRVYFEKEIFVKDTAAVKSKITK